MKKKWFDQFVFTPRMACFVDGDPAPAPGGDPAPVAVADPVPAADPTPTTDPAPAADPNDPVALLLSDIDKLNDPEPAADPNAPAPQPGSVPQEFLSISPFVTDAQTMQQAVRAADEVWKVATGEANAGSLLEGIRTANPQRFQGVVNELTQYLEQVTGKKFGDGTPADPVAQLRQEIQDRETQREQAAQQAQYQGQVRQAAGVAMNVVKESLKGTFAEGQEQYFLAQCAQKAGIPEQQMVAELLRGNKAPLEAAVKAVRREEVARLKMYNENLVKQRKSLGSSVPATKNTPASATISASAMKPGETRVQYAQRLWEEGQPKQ